MHLLFDKCQQNASLFLILLLGKSDAFLFIDDDYTFSTKNLLQYLNTMDQSQRRQLLSGPLTQWRPVIRPFQEAEQNKWAILPRELPWPQLPIYAPGCVLLMGTDVLHEVTIAEAYTRFLYVDDVYLGFVVVKLPGRTWQNLRGFYEDSKNHDKAIASPVLTRCSLQLLFDTITWVFNFQHLWDILNSGLYIIQAPL